MVDVQKRQGEINQATTWGHKKDDEKMACKLIFVEGFEMKSEAKIQAEILAYIRTELRWKMWGCKVIVSNERGVPDIIACRDGKFVAIEVKKPGQQLTQIQQAQLSRIFQVGGSAYVVHSLDEFKEVVKTQEPV